MCAVEVVFDSRGVMFMLALEQELLPCLPLQPFEPQCHLFQKTVSLTQTQIIENDRGREQYFTSARLIAWCDYVLRASGNILPFPTAPKDLIYHILYLTLLANQLSCSFQCASLHQMNCTSLKSVLGESDTCIDFPCISMCISPRCKSAEERPGNI